MFNRIINSIHDRGFRNYGLEGKMRKAIHLLEASNYINLSDILMLRRHEKDFIIRQDPLYLKKHEQLVDKIIVQLHNNSNLASSRKDSISTLLMQYKMLFDQVVIFERVIGIKTNTGLKNKLDISIESLIKKIERLKYYSISNQELMLRQLNLSLAIFWVLYIFLSFFLSVRLSKKFTVRISTLNDKINYFVNSNFSARMNLNLHQGEDEIGRLWNNFAKMEREIVEYIHLFQEKVDEKTLELSLKNEQIEFQNKELNIQQKETEQKNKDLIDGMRYGWRIQSALIPSNKTLTKSLGDSFVLFKPKDIVSGDIYWARKTNKQQDEEHLFSVIDCTGHGVPGAFMSILAIKAIEDASINKKLRKPKDLIQSANDYVFKSMKYHKNHTSNYTKDGMDMILCKLNRKNLILEYSGANRPLYLVRSRSNSEHNNIGLASHKFKMLEIGNCFFYEIFPTKKTVGTQNQLESKSFKQNKIQLQTGDMLYLTSDGYADQFGGKKNKKFMIKNLRHLLAEINEINTKKQKLILEETILNWQGSQEQIDDITIMGVRI